jgi:hypothetical protein
VTLVAFQDALRTQLTAALGITLQEGKLEGPAEGGDLGCIFPVSEAEDDRWVQVGHYRVAVRVFKERRTPLSPREPHHDPDPLLTLATTLKTSIQGAQTGLGGTWFHRVVSLEYDWDAYGVQAIIVSTQKNEATLP